MAQKYKVHDNLEWMFLDSHCWYSEDGYISYRHVICHTIHHAIHKYGLDTPFITSLLASGLLNWDRKINHKCDYLFDLLFSDPDVTVVDHSKGCHPLVLDIPTRIEAFDYAIRDIYLHVIKIVALLESDPNWTKQLQLDLEKLYNLP